MRPIPILIASVLKPLKDPRAYYRFGLSLRETNKYQINIIGFSTKKEADEKNIKFHPLFLEKRQAFSRIFASLVFYRIYKKERPKLSIICTWELIPSAILCTMLFGGKLVYDVQENYALNISYNRTLKGIKKWFAKNLILLTEYFGKFLIDHYIFSEQCYKHEKKAFKPYFVLENKYFGAVPKNIPSKKLHLPNLRFLISGTITEVYGIKEAMQWFLELRQSFPEISLHIIGHCPIPDFAKILSEMAKENKGIHLQISGQPVPYEQIMEAYAAADVVLLPYHQIPSISPKIPSKLFESLALGKPFFYSPNLLWKSFAEKYQAGLEVDFSAKSLAAETLHSLLSMNFYSKDFPYEAFWIQKERLQLQNLVSSLLEAQP
ncbi:glycosyltransferase [Cecembia calidifontis]|uniref:Glycosyltransferase involved in cell wall biosynthesis n=1 Tax=Cecembia calidifontis TaxID=1187080 RepID=A0A4Q7PCU7_9BACT|nr:glycosyltransferase [Cecembia calidifontis]RZS97548.1 glycosyltransferase involved in cell wall biosynthesis [Cecembia calidifontis]